MRLLFALLLTLIFGSAAQAEERGVLFAQMPVGLKITYKDYEGDVWTDRFKGKSGKFYIMNRTYKGKTYFNNRYYNASGHLVRIMYNNGAKSLMSPQSCDQVIGACEYIYKGNPKYNGKYKTTLTKSGAKYVYSFVKVPSEDAFEYVYTFGKYNLIAEETWTSGGRKRWRKIISMN